MYKWGDPTVDWRGLNDAAFWIGDMLWRYGRISVTDTKEKWGEVRVYCYFGWVQLHSITHPGYAYKRYPDWLWNLDCLYLSRVIGPMFNWAVIPLQRWWYRKVYRMALKKWPHLAESILVGADQMEWLIGLDPRLTRTMEDGCQTYHWTEPGKDKANA